MNFSIIIPAKNEEKNIRHCLQSINAVDWPREDMEVLVVDNGSSDGTVEAARSHGARVFERPGDTIAGLRNFGARQAGGKVLAFLDADCTVSPQWLREASRYLDRGDVAAFGSPPVIPSENTWVQRAWFHVRGKEGAGETSWLESMNLFVPGKIFDQVGGFNEDLITCEDYDLSKRLKKLGTIVADDRIVAVHHGEAASLSHFFRKEMWRARSNLERFRERSFEWDELPSLLLPLVHCIVGFLVMGLALTTMVFSPKSSIPAVTGLLLAWQIPLFLLALWKTRTSKDANVATQLFVLLNVYFFARGLSGLKKD